MIKSIRFYLGVLIFSLLISIPLLIPYLKSGYFPTHDGEWAVVRLSDMFREVRDLQIPPRLSGNLNFGYGIPVFNFAYPLPYYIGLVFKLLGFGFVESIKLVFALSIPISAFFMFLASRNIWKNDFAGIISSVIYLYFPYRIVDLFVRGSIGESVAFAIFPVIIFVLSKLLDNPRSSGYKLAGGVLFGLLILAHNIMAVLFSITLLILFIGGYLLKGREIIKPGISIIILGFVLSAYFWIPAIMEKKYTLISVIDIADKSQHFLTFKDLLFSSWGFGIANQQNGFSLQLGWPFIGIIATVIISLIYLNLKKIKNTDQQKLASVLLVGIFILSILLFKESSLIWELPLLNEITFPWNILSQLGLLISILAGYLAIKPITKYLAIGFSLIALLLYIPVAKPIEYVDRGDAYYFTNDNTTTSSNEFIPLWVKEIPFQRPIEKVEILNGEGQVSDVIFNSKEISFNIDLDSDSIVRINTIYYPGWNVFVNEEPWMINYVNNKGVMDLELKKGSYIVEGTFGETKLRLIADIISVIGIIYVIIFSTKIVYNKFYDRRKKAK